MTQPVTAWERQGLAHTGTFSGADLTLYIWSRALHCRASGLLRGCLPAVLSQRATAQPSAPAAPPPTRCS